MAIVIVKDCSEVDSFGQTDQPGLYVIHNWTVLYRSTYEGECCPLFKPGIMECADVEDCDPYGDIDNPFGGIG